MLGDLFPLGARNAPVWGNQETLVRVTGVAVGVQTARLQAGVGVAVGVQMLLAAAQGVGVGVQTTLPDVETQGVDVGVGVQPLAAEPQGVGVGVGVHWVLPAGHGVAVGVGVVRGGISNFSEGTQSSSERVDDNCCVPNWFRMRRLCGCCSGGVIR